MPYDFFEKYTSDVALKGLKIAIQLSTHLEICLSFDNKKDEERFKNVFPSLIAAALIAGTKLDIIDRGKENLNKFAANEIEKAGAHIDLLRIDESVNLCRLIAKAKEV